jgi:Uma2 family endonuclease
MSIAPHERRPDPSDAYRPLPRKPIPVWPSPPPPPGRPEDYDFENIVVDDGEPVENVFAERQYRLLTEPLHSNWAGPGGGRPFAVFADVGLFFAPDIPPVVPDVMLSLDVPGRVEKHGRLYNSYFLVAYGKVPEVVIEIVSDREGEEEGRKKRLYRELGIAHYAVFDPLLQLDARRELTVYHLRNGRYVIARDNSLPAVGLGLAFWEGVYCNTHARRLRWTDAGGRLIPTGGESTELARREAADEKRRAEQAAKAADDEKRRADQAAKAADDARQAAERMAAKLRELGIDPGSLS